ncbi:hypothetical protein O9929_24705 [Vibrio lentus]|nr:hypothetical protein [Vibrio lentus]
MTDNATTTSFTMNISISDGLNADVLSNNRLEIYDNAFAPYRFKHSE